MPDHLGSMGGGGEAARSVVGKVGIVPETNGQS